VKLDKTDRRLTVLVWMSFGVLLALTLFALFGYPRIVQSAADSNAIRVSSELSGCRAGYRASIDRASADLDGAKATLEATTFRGLVAVVLNDDTTLQSIVEQADDLNAAVDRAQAALEQAVTDYEALIQQSRQDPDQFLDQCHRDQGDQG
jgi:hypothetical protein